MLPSLPIFADGVFTISDRTELRARTPDQVTGKPLALDFDTLGDVRAEWKTADHAYTLADLPRYTLLDYNGNGRQGAVLDSAIARGEWKVHRVRLNAQEYASYGDLSFESLSALTPVVTPTPVPGQPPPVTTGQQVPQQAQEIRYASSDTSIGSTALLRRWTIDDHVGYQLQGGVTTAAQEILPFQQGPYGEVRAIDKTGAHDELETLLDASNTTFSLGTEDLLASLEEHWRHKYSPHTETMLGGGWYAARTRADDGAPYVFASNPIAEGEFDEYWRMGHGKTQLRLDVRLAPFINRLTGLVDEQVRGTIEGSWERRRLKFALLASGAESTQQGAYTSMQYATAEADTSYKFSEVVSLDGGVRALYQEQNGCAGQQVNTNVCPPNAAVDSTNLHQVIFFLGLTVRPVKAHF
ncbi:MAG TPA: hypothetical protein VIY73_01290 [Polyangiaceae bacterium]